MAPEAEGESDRPEGTVEADPEAEGDKGPEEPLEENLEAAVGEEAVVSTEEEIEAIGEVTGEPESEPDVEPEAKATTEASGPPPELTVRQIWDAPKFKLQEWCREWGLDDTGPIMNMRLRLLSRIESA